MFSFIRNIKMIPPIEIEEELMFGRHRGKTVLQIWKGYDNDIEVYIEKYLQFVFDTIGKQKTEVDQKIKIPKLSEEFIKSNLNMFFNNNEIKFKLIVKERHIHIIDTENNGKIIELIKTILNCDFENIKWDYFKIGNEPKFQKITNEDIEDKSSFKNFQVNPGNYDLYLNFKNKNPKYIQKSLHNFELKQKRVIEIEEINGDPQYIFWCLKTFKHKFYLHTSDIEVLEETSYKFLKSFEFEYKNDNCIQFKPIFRYEKINFPKDIKIVNKELSEKYDSWEDSNQPYNYDNEDENYYWKDYDNPEDFYNDNVLGRG